LWQFLQDKALNYSRRSRTEDQGSRIILRALDAVFDPQSSILNLRSSIFDPQFLILGLSRS